MDIIEHIEECHCIFMNLLATTLSEQPCNSPQIYLMEPLRHAIVRHVRLLSSGCPPVVLWLPSGRLRCLVVVGYLRI